MRNFFRKFGLFFLMLFSISLFACENSTLPSGLTVESITVETELPTMLTLADFDLGEVTIEVTNADQTKVSIPVTSAMLSAEDLAKLATVGTHTITVNYQGQTATFLVTLVEDDLALELRPIYELGFSTGAITLTYPQWLESIRGTDGEDGADGREIVLRVSDGKIQWQYTGAASWTDLIAISELVGPAGANGNDGINGTNGKEVTFRISEGHLQWQYVGDANWVNLLQLSTLTGNDGVTPTISISIDGFWIINGTKTEFRAVPETPVVAKVTLTFDCTGGSLAEGIASNYQNLNKGDIVNLPVPTKNGYVFAGWFTGNTPNDGQFTNTSILVCSLQLVAHWAPDYGPLSAILATLADGNNFTVLNTISSVLTNGDKRVEEALVKFSPDGNNHKVTSFVLNTREYENEVLISEQLNAMRYFAVEIDNYEYFYRFEVDGNYFGSRKIGGFYTRKKASYPTINQPFELLKADHFVKRDNENIFDYMEVDQNLYDFAQMIYNGYGSVDGAGLIASFNGDSNELLISIPVLDEDGMVPYSVVQYRYVVTEVGTTSVTFPFADAKDYVADLLAEIVSDRIELIQPTDETLSGFNALYIALSAQVASATDVVTLDSLKDTGSSQLNSFELITDPIKSARASLKSGLLLFLNEKIEMATAESIIAMTTAHEAGLLALDAATTIELLQTALDDCKAAINAAYVGDPDKVALAEAKYFYNDTFYGICSLLCDLVTDYSTEAAIWTQCDQAEALFNAATSVEEVQTIMTNAITTLRNSGYMLDPIMFEIMESDRQFVREYYLRVAQLILDETGTRSVDLDNKYMEVAVALQNADIYDLLLVYSLSIEELNDIALPLLKPVYLNEVSEMMAQYALVIPAEILTQIETESISVIANLNEVDAVDEFYMIVEGFRNYADCLITDELHISQLTTLRTLAEVRDDYKRTATEESILYLDIAYLDAQTAVLECLTSADVDTQYFTSLSMLQEAYLYDIDKLTLEQLRNDANMFIDWISEVYDCSFDGVYFSESFMNDLFEARYDISDVMTQAGVDEVIIQLVDRFDSLPIAISFDFIDGLTNNLDMAISNLEIQFGTLPDSFISDFVAARDNLWNISDLGNLCWAYMLNQQSIEDYYRIDLWSGTEENITQLYDQFYPITIDDQLADFEVFYQETLSLINATADYEIIDLIEYRFSQYCTSRTIDEVKNSRVSALNYARGVMEERFYLSSDESIASMESCYDVLTTNINNETDQTVIDNLVNQFIEDLTYLYVEDPVKAELEALRNIYLSNLSVFYEMVSDGVTYAEDPLLAQYWNEYALVISDVDGAADLSELNTVYNNGMINLHLAIQNFVFLDLESLKQLFQAKAEQYFFDLATLGEPYVEDVILLINDNKDTLMNQLNSAISFADMFNAYVSYLNSSNAALLESRYITVNNMMIGQFNNLYMRLPSAEQSGFNVAFGLIRSRLDNSFMEYSLDYLIPQFDFVFQQYLPLIDPLLDSKRNAIESIQGVLEFFYPTSTGDSRNAQYAAQTAGFDAIYAATTIEEVDTAMADAIAAIELAYVEDPAMTALYQAIDEAVYDFSEKVQLVLDTSSDTVMLNKWLILDNDWFLRLTTASFIDELNVAIIEINYLIDSIEPEYDEMKVNAYRDQMISNMTVLRDSMESELTAEDFSFVCDYYDGCVTEMNAAIDPFEILNYVRLFDDFLSGF